MRRALCHVLEQLVSFLRNDIKGDFAPTSALYVVIMACQDQIQDLYRKLEKLQVRAGDKAVAGIVKRAIQWPLKKEECRSTHGHFHVRREAEAVTKYDQGVPGDAATGRRVDICVKEAVRDV